MRPVRTLAPSTPGPDSAERELTDAFCRAGWLLVTVLDYYGCCFVLCGVILSSEPFPSSIIWALGCCLVGTPACALQTSSGPLCGIICNTPGDSSGCPAGLSCYAIEGGAICAAAE